MSTADLYEDGFPHWTREGYARGCRGGACPGRDEHGFTCTDAKRRYAGDYTFRRLVDEGLTPAEIAARIEAFVPPAQPAPRATPRPRPQPVFSPAQEPTMPKPAPPTFTPPPVRPVPDPEPAVDTDTATVEEPAADEPQPTVTLADVVDVPEISGHTVRTYRAARGWSQATLAVMLATLGAPGLNQIKVSSIERDLRRLSPAETRAMRTLLDALTAPPAPADEPEPPQAPTTDVDAPQTAPNDTEPQHTTPNDIAQLTAAAVRALDALRDVLTQLTAALAASSKGNA